MPLVDKIQAALTIWVLSLLEVLRAFTKLLIGSHSLSPLYNW